jgi:hypothetical protein
MGGIHDKILAAAEMSRADHKLIEKVFEQHAPQKILEAECPLAAPPQCC